MTCALSFRDKSAQSGNAFFAPATASFTTSAEESGTWVMTSPFSGLNTSRNFPLEDMDSPSIKLERIEYFIDLFSRLLSDINTYLGVKTIHFDSLFYHKIMYGIIISFRRIDASFCTIYVIYNFHNNE